MSNIDLNGFDKSDFASFSNDNIEMQQLPSLPIDDVLPKADKSINEKQKNVSFEQNEIDESLQTIVPNEKKEEKEEKEDVLTKLYIFFQENLIFLIVLLFLIVIMLHRHYY